MAVSIHVCIQLSIEYVKLTDDNYTGFEVIALLILSVAVSPWFQMISILESLIILNGSMYWKIWQHWYSLYSENFWKIRMPLTSLVTIKPFSIAGYLTTLLMVAQLAASLADKHVLNKPFYETKTVLIMKVYPRRYYVTSCQISIHKISNQLSKPQSVWQSPRHLTHYTHATRIKRNHSTIGRPYAVSATIECTVFELLETNVTYCTYCPVTLHFYVTIRCTYSV